MKATISAMLVIGLSSQALAQHHTTHHYGYASYTWDDSAYMQQLAEESNKAFEIYKQAEAKILANPHSALDQLISMVNKSHQHNHNGHHNENNKIYNLTIEYTKDLPPGEVSEIRLTPGANGKVNLTIRAHESARKNPFVLLESMVNLNNLHNLSSFNSTKMALHKGAHPKHGYAAYHVIVENLGHTLGVQSSNVLSTSHYSGELTAMELMELKTNAEAGSVLAQRRLAEINQLNFQSVKQSLSTFHSIKQLSEPQKRAALVEYAAMKGIQISSSLPYEQMMKSFQDQLDLRQKRQIEELNVKAKKVYSQQVQEYKAGAAEREELVQSKSLSDMVKANDREGVAKAMEKMFPWSLMEPTEKFFWKEYVEAIRKPNYENAPILFRGIDQNEKLQSVTNSQGKVVGGGLFSKRLTAGSGSHLFKLKGLPDTFETFGTHGVDSKKRISPLNEPHSLTRMMINHAMSPQGSPFISLTYDLGVASNFSGGSSVKIQEGQNPDTVVEKFLNSNASGGVATIRMDKRRLLTNSVSMFQGELEILASMLIFPDEVLHLEKGTSYSIVKASGERSYHRTDLNEYYQRARSAVYEKTGVTMPESFETLKKQGNKAFFDGLTEMEVRFSKVNPSQARMCSKVFQ
ncbi:hypothetical protein [Bdellovibrio bacteriovorus]|uniref:hypothetical protein n=1 Tax=Bdellovibrio TaxID=958 RepID=UPI0035A9874A